MTDYEDELLNAVCIALDRLIEQGPEQKAKIEMAMSSDHFGEDTEAALAWIGLMGRELVEAADKALNAEPPPDRDPPPNLKLIG